MAGPRREGIACRGARYGRDLRVPPGEVAIGL